MWQLAAPHTWPAAIVPCFLAACAASVTQGSISIIMVFVLLAISILMQSSVNSFNDYYDFVKGADSADDGLAADDAVLVYNKVNPGMFWLWPFLSCLRPLPWAHTLSGLPALSPW